MANYKKRKARRNSTRCTMCKLYKKVGNAKYHWSHKDWIKLKGDIIGETE